MSTNTNTNPVSATETAVDPKAALAEGVSTYLRREAKVWADVIDACADLAAADAAASDLSDAERGRIAAKVVLPAGSMVGHAVVRTMSTSTYSKRVKVGRMARTAAPAADVKRIAPDWADANAAAIAAGAPGLTWSELFELACDHPTPNGFYDFLPKAAHLAKPKGTGRRAAAKPGNDPVTVAEVLAADADSAPETVAPFRWDDAHIATGASAVLASLRAQGADEVTIRLVIAECGRLASPVRSVA